jgi:hypothetical protein
MDITGKELAGALTLAASSGLIAKLLVDLVKAGGLAVTWLYPVLAVVFGVAASFLVLFANGAAITQASAATALIAGVLAGAAAAGGVTGAVTVTPPLTPPVPAVALMLTDTSPALDVGVGFS